MSALFSSFRFRAVAGRHRDADVGADNDGMAVEQIGFADVCRRRASSDRILRPRHTACMIATCRS